MKLQLEGQQLRVRVSEAEFAQLLAGTALEAAVQLPGTVWTWRAQPVAEGDLRATAEAASLQLLLPLQLLSDYQKRLPCRDGLEAEQTVSDAPPLRLSFEVDVRDSVRTRGPRRRT
jgi:hypothetical protein